MRTRLTAVLLTFAATMPAFANTHPIATWRRGGATLECHSPFWVSLHHVIWAHAFIEVDQDGDRPTHDDTDSASEEHDAGLGAELDDCLEVDAQGQQHEAGGQHPQEGVPERLIPL